MIHVFRINILVFPDDLVRLPVHVPIKRSQLEAKYVKRSGIRYRCMQVHHGKIRLKPVAMALLSCRTLYKRNEVDETTS